LLLPLIVETNGIPLNINHDEVFFVLNNTNEKVNMFKYLWNLTEWSRSLYTASNLIIDYNQALSKKNKELAQFILFLDKYYEKIRNFKLLSHLEKNRLFKFLNKELSYSNPLYEKLELTDSNELLNLKRSITNLVRTSDLSSLYLMGKIEELLPSLHLLLKEEGIHFYDIIQDEKF